ncbi:MAG: twin-arginine translocation signal domain-containing protein, partial [Nitratireductor sp.]|nr:twin-arginine translocation signal domain-containing protein [Nitratireductor sp.]
MSKELEYLSRQVAFGKMDRRAFLGRASALGVSAVFANSLRSSSVLAAGPIKGGIMKVGSSGGESTNSLDPATYSSAVPFLNGKQFGDTLVDVKPDNSIEYRLATEVGSSPDAKVWTFKIRKDVEFHNGKTMTPADVLATMERHSDENSKSGALGVMKG